MRGWHSAVLTEEEVLLIVDALDKGETQTRLAEEFGVSSRTIHRIKHGQRWGALTGRGTDPRRDKKK
jgi:uncharacterized protein YerC